MKILKITGVILVLVLVVVAAIGFYFKYSLTPTYTGSQSIPGLQEEVSIYYTDHGIPHIYASNEHDGYLALGYVHAQDRLWQMDLLRHVGGGRLSELFGSDLLASDRFLRTVGISEYAKQSVANFIAGNHESKPVLEAYLKGINAFIAENPKALEHYILGVDVAPFTIESVYEVLTYMAFSFTNAHKTDPLLTELYNKLDSSYVDALVPYHYKGETVIRNYDTRFDQLSAKATSSLSKLKAPEFIGSNSWVLAPEKTENGQVILTNDPHIGFAQPSVWYESHLVIPDHEIYGYYITGSPFALVFHNEQIANGMTMFENDDLDFYVEEIHPEDSNTYRHKGEWKEMEVRKEVINVKGAEPVEIVIRSTVHGPIVSDILTSEPLEDIVSMYWIMPHYPNRTIEAIMELNRAKNLEEVERAVEEIHAPGLNIMYGDAAGNIAWWAAGKLIKRKDERTSKSFYEGSTGENDPDSTYDFSKNPHSVNPEWNYVYSANNQPDTVDGIVYSGYYLPDDRGERIDELLRNQEIFGVDDIKKMLLDVNSKLATSIKPTLLGLAKENANLNPFFEDLSSWNDDHTKDDYVPALYQMWVAKLIKFMVKDELGEDSWNLFKGSHTYKVSIEHLVLNDGSPWWDNIHTEVAESRSMIVNLALDSAIAQLKKDWGPETKDWRWGNIHTLTHEHPIGSALSFLNVGPFEMDGANEVINNLGYTLSDSKYQAVSFGPSTRRIVDFSDVRNNSWSILPTGQSGSYFSPFYKDQAEMFANGEYRKMLMNHEEIKQTDKLLRLNPTDPK